MKDVRSASPTLLLCLLLALPASVHAEAATAPGRVTGAKMSVHPDWYKESFLDIAEDVSEAADADKHVILFLEMNGCPYCYKMTEENFKNAPYTEFIRENFDVIALNIKGDREVALDEETSATEKEIAEILKVRYTPTIVFLGQDNKPVARVNGYRNVPEFKLVLDYVNEKAYRESTLAGYLAARRAEGAYSLRDHPRLEAITDLSQVRDRPLAVLFEDEACVACAELHHGHLKDPAVNAALEKMAFVRLDAGSEEPITDPAGNATTPKAWAADLGLTYRPGIVLFDRGREIARIESMLYRYHFTGVLEYVAERHYEEYPESPFRYIDAKTAELTAAGEDVTISEGD
jgi:thioredoxin-related protein